MGACIIDLTQDMGNDDIIVFVPKSLVGDGEPGEPFPLKFETWLRWMAAVGHWPVDFGSADSPTHIELWMKLTDSIVHAQAQCEYFIKKGGDV